jgi:uncharacterized membrane protein
LVGAAVGTATVLRGAQVGATMGAFAGPVGAVAGGVGGAIIAGIFAGSAGCAVGSVAGNLADSNFLDNRGCLECGFTFREDAEPTALNIEFTAKPGHEGGPSMRAEFNPRSGIYPRED